MESQSDRAIDTKKIIYYTNIQCSLGGWYLQDFHKIKNAQITIARDGTIECRDATTIISFTPPEESDDQLARVLLFTKGRLNTTMTKIPLEKCPYTFVPMKSETDHTL